MSTGHILGHIPRILGHIGGYTRPVGRMGVACSAPTHSVNVTPNGAFGRGAACYAHSLIPQSPYTHLHFIPRSALRRLGRSMLRPYRRGSNHNFFFTIQRVAHVSKILDTWTHLTLTTCQPPSYKCVHWTHSWTHPPHSWTHPPSSHPLGAIHITEPPSHPNPR